MKTSGVKNAPRRSHRLIKKQTKHYRAEPVDNQNSKLLPDDYLEAEHSNSIGINNKNEYNAYKKDTYQNVEMFKDMSDSKSITGILGSTRMTGGGSEGDTTQSQDESEGGENYSYGTFVVDDGTHQTKFYDGETEPKDDDPDDKTYIPTPIELTQIEKDDALSESVVDSDVSYNSSSSSSS